MKSSRLCPLVSCRSRLIALGLVACLFPCLVGGVAAAGKSSRNSGSSYLKRMRQQEQAQLEAMKKQRISALQAEHAAAQRRLQQVQQQADAAAGTLKSTMSQVEATRRVVDGDQEEIKAQHRRMHDAEEQVLANRPDDAPDVVLAAQVHKAQRALDARMHELLQVPRTEAADVETEQTRQSELLHLTSLQRAELKDDDEYSQLSAQLAERSADLKRLQQVAFEADKEWASAHTAWQAAKAQKDKDEEDYRRAAAANAQARKSLREAQSVLATLNATLQLTGNELRSLGAAPSSAK